MAGESGVKEKGGIWKCHDGYGFSEDKSVGSDKCFAEEGSREMHQERKRARNRIRARSEREEGDRITLKSTPKTCQLGR